MEGSIFSSGGLRGDTVFAKVVLLGKESVGKTCLATRIHANTYRQYSRATVYVDYLCLKLEGPDFASPVVLQLWDTAGQETFRSLIGFYIRSAHLAIVVYDVTSKASFLAAPPYFEEARKTEPKIRLVLVGNKTDDTENRQIRYKEGKAMADRYECPFYETSAKTGENVDILFDDIGRELSHAMTSPLSRHRDNGGRISSFILEGCKEQKQPTKRKCWC
ncbi:ras-related protein Rab-6-like [Gigantopelta aegis]|uniref:ras-related protein Rab-6-like n=1 Tax=Gigantopelta aegis TaxID=1735272 RepID=UPI001B889A91|nr:ras-related protein Rab-6-like [Gigantopelta aegis]XP_041374503.1 ras-related protein Rab-6-like [Gigantopelta aegis]XP_041374504.1 ras-related protein Rab-6-like [Gigantopelta aegis]